MIIIIITIMLRQFIVNNLGGPRSQRLNWEHRAENIKHYNMFLRQNIYFFVWLFHLVTLRDLIEPW